MATEFDGPMIADTRPRFCDKCGKPGGMHRVESGVCGYLFFCPGGNPEYPARHYNFHERGAPELAALNLDVDKPNMEPTRKDCPLYAGCLSYFPDALLAVARLSKIGNDKHNPGQPLHWSRDKSSDHADCIARHLLTHGTIDDETGMSHTVAVAWRALALLQVEIEAQRAKGGA